jgi:hypothetical protein
LNRGSKNGSCARAQNVAASKLTISAIVFISLQIHGPFLAFVAFSRAMKGVILHRERSEAIST